VPDAIFGKMAPKDIATSDYVLKGGQLVAGPFSVKSFAPNEWIEFVANPKYFRGAPKLAGIIEKKIPDRNTRLLAFEKGEVDNITDSLDAEYDRMTKLPGITVVPYLSTIQALWINYHTDKPNKTDPKYVAMGKKEFRQALAYAIDFEGYRNVATGGKPDLLIPRTCFWVSGIFGFGTCDPSLNAYKYDVEKAKALLKQIGWDAKWEIDFAPYGLTITPASEALQQMWVKAGLNVKLRGQDPATFIAEMYEKGNFDITVLGLGGNANMVDFYYRFRTGNIYNAQTCPACYNLMRYGNPEFDKLVTQASSTADPKVFEPLMAQMTKMWNEELPIMTYGQGKSFMLLGPKVDGKTVEIGNAYNWDNPHLWAMK
jgi:peptide/nickel transport system substrate-binding protein